MLGAHSGLTWVDPICAHLTSERARERAEAIDRVKQILQDPKQSSRLSSNDFNRVIVAFFKMMCIEFKSTLKGEPISATAQAKLQHLLRDAKTLVALSIESYPQCAIEESLDYIFDFCLQIVQEGSARVFQTDVLYIVNSILASEKYIYLVLSSHVEGLVNHLLTSWNTSIAGSSSEMCKCLYGSARYFAENNQTSILKRIAVFVSDQICEGGLDHQADPIVPLYFCRALTVTLSTLGQSHPIFCSSLGLWRRGATIRSLLNFRKGPVAEEFIMTLHEASAFIGPDTAASPLLTTLLKDEFPKLRCKLQGAPIFEADADFESSPAMALCRLLSKYSQIDFLLDCALPLSKYDLDYEIVVLFSKSLLKEQFPLPHFAYLTEAYRHLNSTNMVWASATLGNLFKNGMRVPREIVEICLLNFQKPALAESSLFLISNTLASPTLSLHDVTHMTYASPLSSRFIDFLHQVIVSRLSSIFWSDTGYKAYSHYLSTIQDSLSIGLEVKQLVAALVTSLPNLLKLAVEPSLRLKDAPTLQIKYSNAALLFLDALCKFLDAAGGEVCQSVAISRLNVRNIEPRTSTAVFKAPLIAAQAFLANLCKTQDLQLEVEKVMEVACTAPKLSGIGAWLWRSFSSLLYTPEDFYVLRVSRILSMCLACFSSEASASVSASATTTATAGGAIDDFLTSNQAVQRSYQVRLCSLEILAQVSSTLSNLSSPTTDEQIEEIIDDCRVFIFDQILHLQLSIRAGMGILSKASPRILHSDSILECLKAWRRSSRNIEVLHSALQLVSMIGPDEVGKIKDNLYKVVGSYDVPELSVGARISFINLSSAMGYDRPKFLTQETVIKVLLAADQAGLATSQASTRLPSEVDHLAASLFRLSKRGLTYRDFLSELELLLGSCRRKDLESPHVKKLIRNAVGLADLVKVCCYLSSKGDSILQSLFHHESVVEHEAFWFWTCCLGDGLESRLEGLKNRQNTFIFAPIVARGLLEHHSGSRRVAQHVVDVLKDWLSQSGFEHSFKAHLPKICAYCLLFGAELGFDQNAVRKCLEHICTTVKTNYEDVTQNVYGSLIVLELLSIGEDDKILEVSLVPTLRAFVGSLTLSKTRVNQTIAKQLKKWNISLDLATGPTERSAYSGILEGLILANLDELEQLSLPVALPIIRLIVDVVNGDPDSFASCQEVLLTKANSKTRSLTKYWPDYNTWKGETTRPRLHRLLQGCLTDLRWTHLKDLIAHNNLIFASCRWVLAASIKLERSLNAELEKYFASCTDLSELEELSEAIKIVEKLDHSLWIDLSQSTILFTQKLHSSTALLYLVERRRMEKGKMEKEGMEKEGMKREGMEKEMKSDEWYCALYRELDADFSQYFETKSGAFLAVEDSSDDAIWRKTFSECADSWLICQKWDVDDIPTGFEPIESVDDQIYKLLRQSCHVPEQLFSNSPAARIASSTHNPRWDLLEFISSAFEAWQESKHLGVKERARMVRAIDCAAQRESSGLIAILANLIKGEVLWKLGRHDQSANLIAETATFSSLIAKLPTQLQALAYLKAAKYSWKTRNRSINQIKRMYLDRIPIPLLPADLRSKSLYVMASFYDEQYQKLANSESLQARRRLVKESQRDLSRLNYFIEQASSKDLPGYERSRQQLEDQIAQDCLEIDNILLEREQYALRAAENYQHAIALGEKYAFAMFRLCSLWFSFRRSPQMNSVMKENDFPIKRLLPLMYQLAARVEQVDGSEGRDNEMFQVTLQGLLLRALVDYPLHSLYQLLAIRAASQRTTSSTLGSKRRLVSKETAQERRSAAAAHLILQAKSSSKGLLSLILDVERLSKAYTELALHRLPLKTSTKVAHPFDPTWSISSIVNLACPVPTISLAGIPVGESWEEMLALLPKVHLFSPEGYRVVGGINMPKIVYCLASDGNVYKQLVKGQDDVRQDAVMEQVFILINRILQSNTETLRRGLQLRTYRVIPLQPLAGVIEWIGNAQPIGDYLSRAHERRHPRDVSPQEARNIMKAEFDRTGTNPVSKHQVYVERVVARFHPVLRHFFAETTDSTGEWFLKRQRYIRSTAVGSMAGYIVGLGDRHCQNIMIDHTSGDLIHIDLNMIFEVGKTLRIPERVPFRLTRDIVDGMGHVGLEAGFTNCAVHSLRVLKSRMEMMLMIMEAFKYDPLYRWAQAPPRISADGDNPLAPAHALLGTNAALPLLNASGTLAGRTIQRFLEGDDENEGGGHKEAERALLRVREKLLGMEEGSVLSEAGQVSFLIQQATNEELLAQMYPGWQPWM